MKYGRAILQKPSPTLLESKSVSRQYGTACPENFGKILANGYSSYLRQHQHWRFL